MQITVAESLLVGDLSNPDFTSSSHLPGARRTFLPRFPWDVRQLPALTFLAEGRFQLQEQSQEEQAAGRHGGSGAGAPGARKKSRVLHLGKAPSLRNERLVNYQTP